MSKKRLPVIAFGVLALATVAAFFVVQHLKVANPLVWGNPGPVPAAINPISGRTASCLSKKGVPLNYRNSQLTIAVSRADTVAVYIVNTSRTVIATVSSGTPMQKSVLGTPRFYPHVFTWDGRRSDGTYAPDGTYYFRIVLVHEGKSADLSNKPLQVITTPPQARVESVQLVGASGGAADKTSGPVVFSPPRGHLTIHYTKGHYRRVWLDIYRTDVAGKPERVDQLAQPNTTRDTGTWNGRINGQPAPAGTYLAGITTQNLACDQSSWPVVMPPAPDTTPGAGITIRYLAVTPPLTPTVSGSQASVAVDSPQNSFTWRLRRSGTRKVLEHGSGAAGATQISVRMPKQHAGLYSLVVRAGAQSADVPLVASKAGAAAAQARVLVVLPMLTWMGDSPVDDTGDGLIDTLSKGEAVSLNRPLVNGPPSTLRDAAELLKYLDSMHMTYQLTTDVALSENTGPSLVDRWGVLFPDGEEFLPQSLDASLTGFVKGGGHVLAFGVGAFRAESEISGFPSDTRAGVPNFTKTDLFGAQRGPLTATNGELITELTDDLGLFNGAVAFSGFTHYQPIEPPAGVPVSAAGIANGSPAIVAFKDGAGIVSEVGLPHFGSSLATNVDSQQLLNNAWHVLSKQR